jgi:hypothetical protein
MPTEENPYKEWGDGCLAPMIVYGVMFAILAYAYFSK